MVVQSIRTPPLNLQDLMTCWGQIPEDTFEGLVESMPQQGRGILAAEEGLHNTRQVVLPLRLIGVI